MTRAPRTDADGNTKTRRTRVPRTDAEGNAILGGRRPFGGRGGRGRQ